MPCVQQSALRSLYTMSWEWRFDGVAMVLHTPSFCVNLYYDPCCVSQISFTASTIVRCLASSMTCVNYVEVVYTVVSCSHLLSCSMAFHVASHHTPHMACAFAKYLTCSVLSIIASCSWSCFRSIRPHAC
uniref:Uncharacterized protein n=1 Tax=Lygus hesperus TaxID=30085 RepID=A0A146LZJ9_LYGHE